MGDKVMPIFRTDHCRRFLAHWKSLRAGEAIPTLKDFLAKPDPLLQPTVAIKDAIAPGLLRVRLFGTHLVEMTGLDPTGQDLLGFAASPKMADELWFYQHAVATHPAGLATTKSAVSVLGRPISFEDLELPLTPFPGGPPCVICCIGFVERLDADDKIYRLVAHTTTRWIDIGWGTPRARAAEQGGLPPFDARQ